MSVVRRDGLKVVLPRTGADIIWRLIHEHFAAEDPRKWKYLAMLALRENAGWPLEQIGLVFGHPKGHVTRCLSQVRADLRERFALSSHLLDPTEDERLDHPEEAQP